MQAGDERDQVEPGVAGLERLEGNLCDGHIAVSRLSPQPTSSTSPRCCAAMGINHG